MMGSSGSPLDYKYLVKSDRIHASLYREPRIFADEMERIFHRGWVFVGHESEIPGPGDFVTRTLGTQPVILVRTRDARVAVLLNRCAHRGTLVCVGSHGHARTFACPYHGWTYDVDGELLGVSYPGGYASLDKRTRGLTHAARVASYRGFVFASLSADGLCSSRACRSSTTGSCGWPRQEWDPPPFSCPRISSWPVATSSGSRRTVWSGSS
jgi:phenylpropionate dioxygenase-like ring-hydroxylating dioxygenase large terminal subunit